MAELYGFASNLEEAQMLMAAGVSVIQYRNKGQDHDSLVSTVKKIMTHSHSYPHVQIIVNDSLEAALESAAHGVHLGQDDGDYKSICKQYAQKLMIGVSVDTVQEAIEAEQAGAHSIGAGAVFGSLTKPEAPHMGVPLLKEICRSVSVPVSAIGGITLENLDEVMQAGASYICVISDIMGRDEPELRIQEYLKKLEEG
ncbi:thiamine phosphate synthase [Oceanispirochaeta crateris]|uniref:Thiamine-phosphate synthase n=1 Tax=Oceanispirochaeta crateris TaxID=2518645 RepID=A0A5C1QNF7_9SPIO|nr:thiamine phosphate synthase [Oceanispirochaeta crateris]QEN08106.1 thiamine phosphate synthase [Oceanispirochaeta crateris]